jgi:hypothetical protein
LESIGVVCFQWNSGFREYLPEYVNALARGVKRHLPLPHKFFCVTDETDGFSSDVQVVPTPPEARELGRLASPEGPRFPASYRRLWTFSDEARCLGERVLMLDIDCIVTGDLSPLFAPQDDFVGWRPSSLWGKEERIAGGTWLLRTGTRTDVWTKFSRASAAAARAAGYRGSDQAWMSYCLGRKVPLWPQHCGIYQAQQMKKQGFKVLPKDARIVHFNGGLKSWSPQLRDIPWIRTHSC